MVSVESYRRIVLRIFDLTTSPEARIEECLALLDEAARLQDEIGEPLAGELRRLWTDRWQSTRAERSAGTTAG